MRRIVIGTAALLTNVALTTTALTAASLTVAFLLTDDYYKMKLTLQRNLAVIRSSENSFSSSDLDLSMSCCKCRCSFWMANWK